MQIDVVNKPKIEVFFFCLVVILSKVEETWSQMSIITKSA